MATINPYASPETDEEPLLGVEDLDSAGCYRDGNDVVVPEDGSLPPRCVYCNRPVEVLNMRRRKVKPPTFSFYLFLWPRLEYGLCSTHVFRRRMRSVLFPAIIFLWLGLLMVAQMIEGHIASQVLGWSSLGVLFGMIVALEFWSGQELSIRKRSGNYLRIRNARLPFLNSLPDLNDAIQFEQETTEKTESA